MVRFLLLIALSMCLVACGDDGGAVNSAESTVQHSDADNQYEDDYDDSIDEGMDDSLADDPEYGNVEIKVAGAVSELRSDCLIDVTRVDDIGVAAINVLLGVIEFTNEDQTQFNTGEIAMQRGWSADEGESPWSFAYEVPVSDEADTDGGFWTYDGAEDDEETQAVTISFERQSFDYVTDTPANYVVASDPKSALVNTTLSASMLARNLTETGDATTATVSFEYSGLCQLNIVGDGFASR